MGRFFYSLRFRLISLVLFAVIPAMGMIFYSGLEQRRTEARQIQEESLRLARLVFAYQRQLIESSHQLLYLLAQLPEIQHRDPASCSSLFAHAMKRYPWVLNIGAAYPDGSIFASAVPLPKPINIADRSYFRKAMETHKFSIGEYQIGRIHGKPSVNFGYPVLDKAGLPKAVVYVALSPDWFNQYFDRVNLPSGLTLTLTNHDGMIMARHPEPEKWVGKTMSDTPLVKTILSQKDGTVETPGIDGVLRLYTFMQFNNPDQAGSLYLSIGTPVSEVFGQLDRTLKRNLIFLFLIGLGAIITIWVGGNLLVLRRLKPVVNAAKKLSSGDMSARTGIAYGKGELSKLAFTFDEMARSLEKREKEQRQAEETLRRSEEKYRDLANLLPEVVFETDEKGNLTFVNQNAFDVFGYTQSDFDQGLNVFQMFAPEEGDKIREIFLEALKGETLDLEHALQRKDESQFFASIHSTPIVREGNPVGLRGIVVDITDRKQTEEALRESEETFRLFMEHSPIYVFFKDEQIRSLQLSKNYEKMLGRPLSELIGKTMYDLFPSELARSMVEDDLRVLNEGKPIVVEEEFNGRFYTTTKFPIIREGKPPRLAGFTMDITDRKRAGEEIRRKTVLLAAINKVFEKALDCQTSTEVARMGLMIAQELTGSPFGFIGEVNKTGLFDTIAMSDPGWEKCQIAKTEAIVQINDMEIRGIWGQVIKARKSLIVNEPSAHPERVGIPEGHPAITSFLGVPLEHSGRTFGMIALANKNSGYSPIDQEMIETLSATFVEALMHKRAEEALQESEERYKTIFRTTGAATVIIEEDTTLSLVNTEFEKLSGYDKEEIEGKRSWTEFVEQKHLKRMAEYHNLRRINPNLVPRSYESKFIDNNGNMKDVLITVSMIPGTKKSVASLLDVTEAKKAEKEMAALQEQLRQSQKMEAVGRLAGGIAHDFNNLLTVIKGYSQFSLLELNQEAPLRETLEEIQRASDKAAKLTHQLLAFSRRQIMEMRVLDLNTILRDVEKMLRRIIGEDIELVTRLASDLGKIKTDPGQIEQVIMNLAVNARDAMPNGGKLIIETANVALDEEYARNHVAVKPGNYVLLSVSDTGCGMSPEVKERLFDPFFTTKEKGKGTGLGLSTVYGIVKQSEGNIWVYSEPGQGTAVKIYLPRVDEPLEEFPAKIITEEVPRGNETILVVEDDEALRKLAVRVLERQGYTILEASHGNEALHICQAQKEPIHLILVDVIMPEMSGRQLVDSLKPVYRDFKVLYMSGYTDNAIVHHGVLEKGVNYLQKPFTFESLLRKVREVLDK